MYLALHGYIIHEKGIKCAKQLCFLAHNSALPPKLRRQSGVIQAFAWLTSVLERCRAENVRNLRRQRAITPSFELVYVPPQERTARGG